MDTKFAPLDQQVWCFLSYIFIFSCIVEYTFNKYF